MATESGKVCTSLGLFRLFLLTVIPTMIAMSIEAVEAFFSTLDIVTVVRLRRVCTVWNEAAKRYLAKLKVLYLVSGSLFSKNELCRLAPWLEAEELELYKRKICNFIKVSDKTQFKHMTFISFVAKYCPDIEAYITNLYIPFNEFVESLGPKLKLFVGELDFKNNLMGCTVLKNFPKLEGFHSYGNIVCSMILISYNLPLKYIRIPCLPGCKRCPCEFLGPKSSVQTPLPFVKLLELDCDRKSITQASSKFTFPNLTKIFIHCSVHQTAPISFPSPSVEELDVEMKALRPEEAEVFTKMPNLKFIKLISMSHRFVYSLLTLLKLGPPKGISIDWTGTQEEVELPRLHDLVHELLESGHIDYINIPFETACDRETCPFRKSACVIAPNTTSNGST